MVLLVAEIAFNFFNLAVKKYLLYIRSVVIGNKYDTD